MPDETAPAWQCDYCEAPAVVIDPGHDAGVIGDLFDPVRMPDLPVRCWCLPCAVADGWPRLTGERGGEARAWTP
jgi:hypothetical protein